MTDEKIKTIKKIIKKNPKATFSTLLSRTGEIKFTGIDGLGKPDYFEEREKYKEWKKQIKKIERFKTKLIDFDYFCYRNFNKRIDFISFVDFE